MRFSREYIDELKDRLPDYIETRHGIANPRKQFRCIIPGHEDSTPSMCLHRDRDGVLRARCFGCGWSGDLLDLVSLDTGIDKETEFAELVQETARLVNFGLVDPMANAPIVHRPARPRQPEPPEQPEGESIFAEVEAAHERLFEPEAAEALSVLHERGFTDAEIAQNGWGWTPRPHDLMPGFNKKYRSPGGFLVLPVPHARDWNSVCYAVVRPVGKSNLHKELKPAGTTCPIWHEYALHEGGTIYVCEGIFDAVAASIALDVPASSCTALMGTSGVDRMLNVLRLVPEADRPRVVLALDNDGPGRLATGKAIEGDERLEGLKSLRIPYKVIKLPKDVKDMNDWLLASGTRSRFESEDEE